MPSSLSPAARRVIEVMADLLVVAAAMVGSALALAGSPWSQFWVLVALLVLFGLLVLTREPGWMPLGQIPAVRSAVVAAVGVCLVGSAPGSGTALAAGLGTSLLVGSIAVEQFVARSVRFEVPIAVGLPDLPVPVRRRHLAPLAFALSLLASAVGLVLAALGTSPWWWVLAAVVAVVPVALLVRDGRAKIVLARKLRTEIPRAVARYAPDFVLYTSRPDDASYQILMWLPYLKRTGRRFIVVTRNSVPAQAMADQTDVPVVEARGAADLDALVAGGSLKAAFYVNASSGNGTFVRFQHLRHVYLGHGDSDKPPSYNPTHAMYDRVFAAGPAATRRYAAHGVLIPAEKFRIVGRPQVEQVDRAQRPIADISSPTVLYAPTWRGHVEETRFSSLPTGDRIVAALLDRGATVIFRPHPFSYDFEDDAAVIARIQALLAADARRTSRAHIWGAAAGRDRGIFECINASDAMVSDVSSVVSDYLFSGKPFAMIAVPAEPDAFQQEFPIAQASYVIRGDLADMVPRLDQMLGADPLVAQRLAVRNDYLGDFPADNYASAFVDAVVQEVVAAAINPGPDEAEADDAEEEADDGRRTVSRDSRHLHRAWSAYRPQLTRIGLHLLGTGLSLLAFTTALLGTPALLVALLGLAAVVASYGAVRERASETPWWSLLLGAGDATRMVLALTTVVAAWHNVDVWWPYLIASMLAGAVFAVERPIQTAWAGGLLVRNLPAALKTTKELVPRALLPWTGATVVLIGLGAIAFDAPPALTLVPASLSFLAGLEVVARSLWRAGEVERSELRLPEAVREYGPRFAVYFSSPVGAGYQIGMWLPYFVRIGRPFIIVTRTAPMLRAIEKLCLEYELDVPIIFRPSLRSVEEIIVDSMSAAFYVNNAARNTHFVERRDLTHVWLNHGDSEKPACFNPVHAIYDLIFAAGQAGIDRYARHGVSIPQEKFRIVGRPQVERIAPARAPIAAIQVPTVLYAPTWQGPFADSRVYSLPIGREIVTQALRRGARVIFRAHTFNYRYADAREMISDIGELLDADRAATGLEHLWGRAAESEMSIEDCFNASDVMISDVSAVVSDYLHSGKPLAMVSMGRTPEQLVVDAPAARAAYVLREDLSNLVQVFDDLLGADPLAPDRQQTKIYYLGDFPDETYAEGFLQAAREVIDAGRNPV